jgi:hypothetical protein
MSFSSSFFPSLPGMSYNIDRPLSRMQPHLMIGFIWLLDPTALHCNAMLHCAMRRHARILSP